MSEIFFDSGIYSFECPHCKLMIQVAQHEINCTIFRHGFFFTKDPRGNIILLNQMNPHTSKEECDSLFNQGKIYGCGKPFQMIKTNNTYSIKICDYI